MPFGDTIKNVTLNVRDEKGKVGPNDGTDLTGMTNSVDGSGNGDFDGFKQGVTYTT
jgi:hypothetical protein